MLEKYKYTQDVFYNILSNAIVNNKISHAYLFDNNNNPKYMDIIYSFVKTIFCNKNCNCENCNICNRIDNGNLLELKVINPDGLQIKKEQLGELQEEFNKKSLETGKKVYIINECDKLNVQAANSILKFLEEPVDDIIAILVTNNVEKVLKTIVSRCQLITLKKEKINFNESSFNNFSRVVSSSEKERLEIINISNNENIFNKAIEFINCLENNKIYVYSSLKNIFNSNIKERLDYVFFYNVMIYFYYDVIKYIYDKDYDNFIFSNEKNLIIKISNNDINNLCYKINLLIESKNSVISGVNLNLILDNLIIKYEGDIICQ